MAKFFWKHWIPTSNVEPIKININDKIVIVFSRPKEIEKDQRAFSRFDEAVSEVKDALNEWFRSSNDQFFALIIPDGMPIEFHKVPDE